MLATFKIDTSDFRRKMLSFEDRLRQESKRVLRQAGEEVMRTIQRSDYWQNQTGKTAKSFSLFPTGDLSMRIASGSKIALFLDRGTKAHWIRPKAATGFKGPLRESQSRRSRGTGAPRPFLVFVWHGRLIFARKVFHPGTTAMRFEEIESRRLETELLPGMLTEARNTAIRLAGLN